MRVEAKPGTELRTAIMSALYHEGYVVPPYKLDDISGHVIKMDNCLRVQFYDMVATIDESNKRYEEILKLIQ